MPQAAVPMRVLRGCEPVEVGERLLHALGDVCGSVVNAGLALGSSDEPWRRLCLANRLDDSGSFRNRMELIAPGWPKAHRDLELEHFAWFSFSDGGFGGPLAVTEFVLALEPSANDGSGVLTDPLGVAALGAELTNAGDIGDDVVQLVRRCCRWSVQR